MVAAAWQSDAPSDGLAYVRRLGVATRAALEARHRLADQLTALERGGESALTQLGRVAEECAHMFDDARWTVTSVAPLRGAELASEALVEWLRLHVEACDALTRAAGTGDLTHVNTAVAILRSAHPFAHQFNRLRNGLADRLAA